MYKLLKNCTAVCTLSERGHGGKKSTFNKSVDITVAARKNSRGSVQAFFISGVERFIADIKKHISAFGFGGYWIWQRVHYFITFVIFCRKRQYCIVQKFTTKVCPQATKLHTYPIIFRPLHQQISIIKKMKKWFITSKFFIALVGWSFISHLLVGIGANSPPS